MNTDGLDLMGESLRIEPVRKYADLTGLIQLLGDDPIFDGNYSKVYQATVRGRMVAVKVLKHIAGKNDEAMERKMTREMNYWAETKSQFIADFLGHALDQQFGPLGAFISPWYSNGDSYMYLQSQKEELTFWDRVDLLYSVANGLVSLHNKGIVHGDLKPSNVLIDSDGNPKICDFGLARLLPDVPSQGLITTSEYTGTPRFLAPELLTSDSMPPTTASDVWAFGCLALEYIFQTMPYAHRLNNHRGMIYQDIKGGRLPCEKTARQGLDDAVQELLHICWHRNHITRPRAKDVRQLVCLLRGSDYPFLCKIGNHGEPGIEAFDIAYAKRTMASKEPSVHVFLRPSSQTLIPFADNIYVRSDWRQWSIFRVLDTLVDEGSQWSVREIHTGRISNLSNPAEARIATIFNLLEEYEAMRKKGGSPFPILPVREWPIHDQGSIFLSMLPPVERGFAQTVLNYLMP